MRVKIIYTMSGRGLHRDAELLSYVLGSLGHEVSSQSIQPASQQALRLERNWYRAVERFLTPTLSDFALTLQRQLRLFINGKSTWDLVIHLQSIQHRHLHKNCAQWLIPNQEWFSLSQVHYLQAIDTVVCKTREAFQLFPVTTQMFSTVVSHHHSSRTLLHCPKKTSKKHFTWLGTAFSKGQLP